jgi:hypothetical protein
MKLSPILGQTNISGNSFFFGADSLYFEQFGKTLAKSLRKHAGWANIHVHLYNPNDEQIEWCRKNQLTASYEYISEDCKDLRTYYACVRFIRIPEIFKSDARIISLDCDGIAVAPITKDKFLKDTEKSAVLWRSKNQRVLASSIFFGADDFRVKLANRLAPYFETDSFKWFLDQVVMAEMMHDKEVSIVEFRDWGNPKIGVNTLIWTVKGDQKSDPEFQKLINLYRD